MPRRDALVLLALLVAVAVGPASLSGAGGRPHAPRAPERPRPNVVVILTDDQTYDDTRVMRHTKRVLGAQGATFTDAVVSFALCCPSRATLFTGQYAHNHRVLANKLPYGGFQRFDQATSLPVWMRDSGYYTVHIGKYLNGYGRVNPRQKPAGWTRWVANVDPTTYRYWNYTLNENGKLVHYGTRIADYETDVVTRKAVAAIVDHAPRKKPLFLSVGYVAPHSGAPITLDDPPRLHTPEPAPRYRDRFVYERLPNPPSFDEANVRDKPIGIRRRYGLSDSQMLAITENYQQRLESLLSVDDGVAAIVRALAQTGELDNTYILFTSDNGYFYGEHRVPAGKVLPYEPALHVPLYIRGPGIKPGSVFRQLVANIDFAPTIADMAGVQPGRIVDGVSLLPLLHGAPWTVNRDIVVESLPGGKAYARFLGVRDSRYQYVEYANGEHELYDLQADPYELDNKGYDPEYGEVIAEKSRELERLKTCAGATCRR